MDKLRSQYLFDLAYLCHMNGRQVDACRYLDFCNYILQIDAYYEAKRHAADQMG